MSTFIENQNWDMQQRNLMLQNNNCWRFKYYKEAIRLSSSLSIATYKIFIIEKSRISEPK
jgi:hypothetical protein